MKKMLRLTVLLLTILISSKSFSQTILRFDNGVTNSIAEYTFTSGDKVSTASGSNFSTSTSNICVSATKRAQIDSVILELVSTSAGTIVVQGTSSGSTSARTIKTIEVADTKTGTYTTVADVSGVAASGSGISSTITSNACGTTTVTGLNIAKGKFVKITFCTSTTSTTKQNVNLSGFDITAAVLPVTFTDVSASLTSGVAKITWGIGVEINTASYEIEKSTDGVSYSSIGSVAATNAGKYSYIDASPASGVNLYRIKAVDKDGKLTYSSVVRINSASASVASLSVYPNPVIGGQLNVQLGNFAKGNYQMRLIGINGQTAFTKSVVSDGGSSSFSVQLPGSVVKGLYQLELTDGISSRTVKTVSIQ
jgi:hypothetical protein